MIAVLRLGFVVVGVIVVGVLFSQFGSKLVKRLQWKYFGKKQDYERNLQHALVLTFLLQLGIFGCNSELENFRSLKLKSRIYFPIRVRVE